MAHEWPPSLCGSVVWLCEDGAVDFDLTRLGDREFEHLSQALALQVLGPGLSVFGDGPDGGREATFEGRMRFPEPGGAVERLRGRAGEVQAAAGRRPRRHRRAPSWSRRSWTSGRIPSPTA
jgi:hypothetical protein